MISALAWIPRGAARLDPQFVEIGENDEEAIKAASDLRDVEEVRCFQVIVRAMHWHALESLLENFRAVVVVVLSNRKFYMVVIVCMRAHNFER